MILTKEESIQYTWTCEICHKKSRSKEVILRCEKEHECQGLGHIGESYHLRVLRGMGEEDIYISKTCPCGKKAFDSTIMPRDEQQFLKELLEFCKEYNKKDEENETKLGM